MTQLTEKHTRQHDLDSTSEAKKQAKIQSETQLGKDAEQQMRASITVGLRNEVYASVREDERHVGEQPLTRNTPMLDSTTYPKHHNAALKMDRTHLASFTIFSVVTNNHGPLDIYRIQFVDDTKLRAGVLLPLFLLVRLLRLGL